MAARRRAGRPVGLINLPLNPPVYPVDGFITTGAFAPSQVEERLRNLGYLD